MVGTPQKAGSDTASSKQVRSSCKKCEEPDTSDMVQCDHCNEWFHFHCVGVTSDIENEPWNCGACQEGSTQGKKKSNSTQKNKTLPSATSRRSKNKQFELEMQRLEEERKLNQEYIEKKYQLLHAFNQSSDSLPEETPSTYVQNWLNNKSNHHEDVEQPDHQTITQPEHKTATQPEHQTTTQPEHQTTPQPEKDTFDERQRTPSPPPHGGMLRTTRVITDIVGIDSTSKNTQDVLLTTHNHRTLQQAIEIVPSNAIYYPQNRQFSHATANQLQAENPSQTHHCNSCYNNNPVVTPADCKPHPSGLVTTASRRLSPDQIAARQVMSKDLRPFSGRLEEWPSFIASFESTTEICGYSNGENMDRLQRCLKGPALEIVRYRLNSPAGVPGAIEALRQIYGRPDLLIDDLLIRIKQEPPPKLEKLETVVHFAQSVQNVTALMESSELHDHLCNPSLLKELVSKLPAQMKLEWIRYKNGKPSATIATFSEWISQIGKDASEVTVPPGERTFTKTRNFINIHSEDVDSQSEKATQGETGCLICSKNCTEIKLCSKFQQLRRPQRWQEVKRYKLCPMCLCTHENGQCNSIETCGVNHCNRKHHPLLHNVNTENRGISDQRSRTSIVNQHSRHDDETCVLFRVVPVMLRNGDLNVETFAFLDEGSSLTLLDECIAEQLHLSGTLQPICLKWTGDTERSEEESRRVTMQISGVSSQSRQYTISNVHTVRDLNLPVQSVDADNLARRFHHLRSIPIRSYNKAIPRILIGLNNWHLALPMKSKEGRIDEPIASKTRLGWAVYGPCREELFSNATKQYHLHICECQEEKDQNLHQLVKSYFVLENMGIEKPEIMSISKDEQHALDILKSTTQRKGPRYETGLLWKYASISLPDSGEMANRRFLCLEKRLTRDPDLRNIIQQRIADHIEKGYIRRLNEEELSIPHPRTWYLPIFPVSNPNKPGKIRIVWDAAAKVDGISLNDMLLKGPDQLPSLTSILLRFRQRLIAICGDIREMFHQVIIREEDQHSQRFLWRTNEADAKPDVYVMQVMTFGAKCSPSSAQFIKNLNAMNFKSHFPRATEAIVKNHYVDDLLDSVDTETEAIQLAEEVRYIHNQGGFEIHHWLSNSTKFMAKFTDPETKKKDLSIATEPGTEKVLGMWWSTKTDTFTFTIAFEGKNKDILTGQKTPTKREVLRVLMSIYDPLGLLAHFLIYAKIILQDIWRSNIEWDDPIQAEQLMKWRNWIRLLPQVENIHFPRCFVRATPKKDTNIQLHMFVDASDAAYAAVAYLRIESDSGIECSLVAAKTKVAPLKILSIPRMELEASLLGTRLATAIQGALTLPITTRHFWTDSKVVMAWLQSDQRRYRQYVAFRIGEILESSNIQEWNWLPSKLNAADAATKWKPPPDLQSKSSWYSGPEFLYQPKENWPNHPLEAETAEELKSSVMHIRKNSQVMIIQAHRFSDWKKMVKSCAFVYRYVANLQSKAKRRPGINKNLTSEEYFKAEQFLFRQAQSESYTDDIEKLNQNKPLSPQSALYRLSPYKDENEVLRIRGRIDASGAASQDTKRPIILPYPSRITSLLISSYHIKYCHSNQETIINELQQRFYIPRLRAAAKKIKKECQYCKNNYAVPIPPEMSSLPPSRLASFTRPFSYIGIDYFGPMKIKIGRRQEKRWGVLVTCLTTRAIHLELAASLSSDSCILSLRRFIARRGTPLEIHSDNGTNFRGASRELREAYQKLKHDVIAQHFIDSSTQWKFIPPASPHMGGCWERLVRSVKAVLSEVIKTETPSEEELHSALLEVEAIVNSRPLTYVPLSSEGDEALTPNHFLLGSSDGAKPVGEFTDEGAILRKSWAKAQRIANSFWRRWTQEYLPTLTRRTKWFQPSRPVEKGDIVIIIDSNMPRNSWPKGIVLDTVIGKDNQVRQATVRTSTGIYVRPAVKLAVLDVRDAAEMSDKTIGPVSSYQGGVLATPTEQNNN